MDVILRVFLAVLKITFTMVNGFLFMALLWMVLARYSERMRKAAICVAFDILKACGIRSVMWGISLSGKFTIRKTRHSIIRNCDLKEGASIEDDVQIVEKLIEETRKKL